MARRHLTRDQKQSLIREQLKETPEKSDRQIAESLGVHHSTVSTQRKSMESNNQVAKLATSIGTDGKEYPRQAIRKPIEFSGHEHVQIPIRKPVSVFNPTKLEETAVKNPEIVNRMSKTGKSAVEVKRDLKEELREEKRNEMLHHY